MRESKTERESERVSVLFLAGWGSLGSLAYGKSALGKSRTEAFHYAVLLKHTQTYRLVFATLKDVAFTKNVFTGDFNHNRYVLNPNPYINEISTLP